MTDEELQQAMQAVSEGLNKLSDPDEPLTKEEKRRKGVLLSRKYALDGIKEAKEKGDRRREITSTIDYSLLTDMGEKHPFLAHIMRLRVRNNILD